MDYCEQKDICWAWIPVSRRTSVGRFMAMAMAFTSSYSRNAACEKYSEENFLNSKHLELFQILNSGPTAIPNSGLTAIHTQSHSLTHMYMHFMHAQGAGGYPSILPHPSPLPYYSCTHGYCNINTHITINANIFPYPSISWYYIDACWVGNCMTLYDSQQDSTCGLP